jgi:hypothetical protein
MFRIGSFFRSAERWGLVRLSRIPSAQIIVRSVLPVGLILLARVPTETITVPLPGR